MITGTVNEVLEAVIPISIVGPGGQKTLDALIDTGFDAWLSLPRKIVSDLKLRWRDTTRAVLADDSEVLVELYDAEIEWHGRRRRVHADSGGDTPLIGMSLLHGSELRVLVVEGGPVSIEHSP